MGMVRGLVLPVLPCEQSSQEPERGTHWDTPGSARRLLSVPSRVLLLLPRRGAQLNHASHFNGPPRLSLRARHVMRIREKEIGHAATNRGLRGDWGYAQRGSG